jgi:hypothetical protein
MAPRPAPARGRARAAPPRSGAQRPMSLDEPAGGPAPNRVG